MKSQAQGFVKPAVNSIKSDQVLLYMYIGLRVDLIERLRIAVERRSPKPDMVPRARLQDAENELTIRNQVRYLTVVS